MAHLSIIKKNQIYVSFHCYYFNYYRLNEDFHRPYVFYNAFAISISFSNITDPAVFSKLNSRLWIVYEISSVYYQVQLVEE